VGVYEAGGNPNVDVSDKAGTAGAYGGVRQSEYEAAQGMADGGSTSDSSRIYDYLMGRGPNPMQFTHTAPQVDYNVNKTPVPITPTTQILESPYDQYGNVNKGGNYDPEKHAEELNQKLVDYGTNSDTGETFTRGELVSLPSERRKEVEARFAEAHPIKYGIGEAIKLTAPGRFLFQGLDAAGTMIKNLFPSNQVNLSDPNAYQRISPTDPFAGGTNTLFVGGIPTPTITPAPEGTPASGPEPQGDPAQRQGQGRGDGGDNGGRGVNPGGYSNSLTRSNDNVGGSQAAIGGLATPYGIEHMARGGLPVPHAFYRQGKFGYKGPQVYADGGIAALAQRYDDGGMTLPLKAQPIKNLGSMHPKALQAAYDRAVSTNDVAGARKYQNELGLRSKLQNVQMYADGGEAEHYNLGSYSDGGRLLKGPGNGTSDDIPATIGHNQPARLADGEFVIPARIVSEIGNGSTDAGARELYKMMDRIQQGRAKTVGKDKVAFDAKARNHLPA
jgi:hypothetical protein